MQKAVCATELERVSHSPEQASFTLLSFVPVPGFEETQAMAAATFPRSHSEI